MSDRREPFAFGCLGVALLVALAGSGMLLWAWNGQTQANGIRWPGLHELIGPGFARTSGTVIRRGSVRGYTRQGSVYPVVRFEVDGTSYEVNGVARESEYLAPGTRVTVVYRRDHPADAHLGGVGQTVPVIMLTGAGLLLLAGGIVGLAYVFRRR